MNKYRLAGVAAVAAVTTPISAYALTFDFSFNNPIGGNVSGVVSGLSAHGTSAATDMSIDSAPAAFVLRPTPYDLFLLPDVHIRTNAFTVSNGQIFGAHFRASDGLQPYLSFSIRLTDFFSSFLYSVAGLEISHVGPRSTSNFGSGRDSFTEASAVVPEPASIALLGAGLAGISAFRRRRRCAT